MHRCVFGFVWKQLLDYSDDSIGHVHLSLLLHCREMIHACGGVYCVFVIGIPYLDRTTERFFPLDFRFFDISENMGLGNYPVGFGV